MVEDRRRVRELLADLEGYLDGLRGKQGVSRKRYVADNDLQDIVERRLEKAAQTCIDIARLVGRLEGQNLGNETNTEVFIVLVELGVLSGSRRQEFVDTGGLRNVLAHRYRHIDAGEIYETYHNLERLERFSESVYRYIHENAA